MPKKVGPEVKQNYMPTAQRAIVYRKKKKILKTFLLHEKAWYDRLGRSTIHNWGGISRFWDLFFFFFSCKKKNK